MLRSVSRLLLNCYTVIFLACEWLIIKYPGNLNNQMIVGRIWNKCKYFEGLFVVVKHPDYNNAKKSKYLFVRMEDCKQIQLWQIIVPECLIGLKILSNFNCYRSVCFFPIL